jgi:hypothetical protein
MRLLTLAALLAFSAQETRRSMTLFNASTETLSAGAQVFVATGRGGHSPTMPDVEVFHRGKKLATWWPDDSGFWMRLAADLEAGKRDAEYAIGARGAVPNGAAVFEFFDDFQQKEVDPARWEWDRDLPVRRDSRGLFLTALPVGRSEFAPASISSKELVLKRGTVFEARVEWKILADASFTFAIKSEVESAAATDEDAVRAREWIGKLEAESIEDRDRATQELVRMGKAALTALHESARNGDSERRARVESILRAIFAENPPPAIAIGCTTGAEERFDRWIQLGKARNLQRSVDSSGGGWRRFTISRDENGSTSIRTGSKTPQSAKVPEKTGRIRFEFWNSKEGAFGQFWINTVILRRFVAVMPTAEFGPEK